MASGDREKLNLSPWVTLAVFFFIQTGGLVWQLSKLNAIVEFQAEKIAEVKAVLVRVNEASFDSLTRRVEFLEGKVK